MYQLIVDSATIKRLVDSAFIPADVNNRDYQEYLKWVSEGNTPKPAEP